MDQKHRGHAMGMSMMLRRMMFDAHNMKYHMHSHFHPLVGSELSHIADLCMATAVKIEEDLESNPETIVVDTRKWPSRVHEFLSEKGEDIYRTLDDYFTPERMVDYTNWLIDRTREEDDTDSDV